MSPTPDDEVLDLDAVEIQPGQARTFEITVPDRSVTIAGNDYAMAVDGGHITLEVTQTHSGWLFRARGSATLTGPCWRCLGDAHVALTADLSDFAAFGRDPREGFDDDLDSEYLDDQTLAAGAMARDALLEDLPTAILCREDCQGLCPTCGIDRNSATCDCAATTTDARWDALRGLADRLVDENEERG